MFQWDKLSPADIKTFQEYISESNKSLVDVRKEYDIVYKDKNKSECLDYEGFRSFMAMYIGSPGMPEDLCWRLFNSFLKRPCKLTTAKPQGLFSKSGSNSLLPADRLRKPFPTSSLSEPTEIKTMLGFIAREKILQNSPAAGSSSSCFNNNNTNSLKSVCLVNNNNSNNSGFDSSCSNSCVAITNINTGSGSGGGAGSSSCEGGGCGGGGGGRKGSSDVRGGSIQLKDLMCWLSLLEAGRPEDKLEFMFRLYDTDANGILDSEEIECIINHMMAVAKYSGWDVSELKPNLQEMMKEVDLNGDGCVTLEEWMKAGSNNIPLIVLLGVDSVVPNEGCHSWELKHFNRPAYCNHCLSLLVGLGKQGLRCIYCRYTMHERCAKECKQACIETYKSNTSQSMLHHWVDGNHMGKCDVCGKYIKAYNKLTGRRCRWCRTCVHSKCSQEVPAECSMGAHKVHILSPLQISMSLLHQSKKEKVKKPSDSKSSLSSLEISSSSPRHSATVLSSSPPPTPPPISTSIPNEKTIKNEAIDTFRTATTTATFPLSSNFYEDTHSTSITTATTSTTTTSTTTTTMNELTASTSLTSIDDLPPSNSRISLQLVPMDGVIPLLVFINPKSGGNQGRSILKKFQHLLNPRQVFNVAADNGFMKGLNFFKELPSYRVLVCGGDGTIGWLLESMDKMNYKDKWPSVAILPLGTGNDLARSLRWGGGYDGEDLNKVLHKISRSSVVMMDRWHVDIKNSSPSTNATHLFPLSKGVKNTDLTNSDLALTYFSKTSSQKHLDRSLGDMDVHNSSPNMLCLASTLPTATAAATATQLHTSTATTKPFCNIINNYFSIGVDASIAHKFHVMREKHPERFNSRMKNKLWYLEYGTSETLRATCKKLHEDVKITCDSVPLDLMHGRSMEGVAILNIASIYGGSNLWGDPVKVKKRKKASESDKELSSGSATSVDLSVTVQDMGDGLLEMVGLVNTMHVAKVKGGIHSGVRLAQASSITIQTTKEFPMQIDGEPWIQPPCFLSIRHHNQVPMLMAPSSNRKSLFHSWFHKPQQP